MDKAIVDILKQAHYDITHDSEVVDSTKIWAYDEIVEYFKTYYGFNPSSFIPPSMRERGIPLQNELNDILESKK